MARKKDDRGTQLPHVLKLEVAALVREKGSIPLSRIKSEYALRYRKPINPKQEISDRWIESIPGILVKNSFAVWDDTWRGAQLNSNSVLADRCKFVVHISCMFLLCRCVVAKRMSLILPTIPYRLLTQSFLSKTNS